MPWQTRRQKPRPRSKKRCCSTSSGKRKSNTCWIGGTNSRRANVTDAIVTHDLTKTYGKSRGIRNVNLAVRQGEIYGFLGPNGAGKSTTLRTIMGFMKPTSGCAEVLGMDSHTQTREDRKSTRLNSSHVKISYAVFCLKKKK